MIVTLAEEDPDLFRSLELATAVATADDETLFAQFKKAITKATHTHGYVSYREAHAWAQNVWPLLHQLADLIAGGRSKLVLRLLDHFFAQMDEALQSVDDSDGEGGAIYAKACEIHLAACRKVKPAPVALAQELFARETESEWDFFDGASETYAAVLGDAGLAEYRRLASEAWQTITPARAGERQMHDEQFGARYRLRAILESFAEREGDIEARITLRARDLSTANSYLGIAQLCAENGREADAIKWAEEGLWQFEDHPDERLALFTADLYRRTGRLQEADELLWRTFEQMPSAELYRGVKKAAGSKKAAVDAARDRAIALLHAKLGEPKEKALWSPPRELLLDVLTSEKLLAEAWQVVRSHGCSGAQLLALAEASERSHPDEAVSAYAQEVERLANLGGQHSYEAASKLIARMQSIRNRSGRDMEHAAYLTDFMSRHKAKRNLMKILQANAINGSRRHAS